MKQSFFKHLALVLSLSMMLSPIGVSEGAVSDVLEYGIEEDTSVNEGQQFTEEYIVATQMEQTPEELDDMDLPSGDELDVDDTIVYVAPQGEEEDGEIVFDAGAVPEDPKADSDTTSDEQDNDTGNVTDKQDITSDEVPEEAATSEGNTDAMTVSSMDNDTKATPENEDEAESNGQSSSEPESEAGSESEMKKEDEMASEFRNPSDTEKDNDGSTNEEVEEVECSLNEVNSCAIESDYYVMEDSLEPFDSLAVASSDMLFESGGSNVYSNPLLDYGMYKVSGNSGFIPNRKISVSTGAHLACDYNDGHTNSNVYPIYTGYVANVSYNDGAGNYVLISHTASDGTEFFSQYQHLYSVSVSIGQEVKKGLTILGKKGDTGNVESEHLHLIVFSRTKGTNINQWPLPQEIFDSNPSLDQTQNVEYTAKPYLDVYIPRYGGNYMRFYNPEKLLKGEYTIGQSSSNTTSNNNTTSINKTYRIKSTTTLGLNIRPSATTASTSLGLLYPGVTIACTKRTNYQSDGYYWLYGTTSTGITGWICENMGWIEEVQNTPASSNTPTTNTSTTNTSTTKKIGTRTVTKSAKYTAKVGLLCQLLFKNGETAKSFKSSNTKVLTVSSTGLVTIKAVGKAKITIKTNKRKYTLTIKTYDPTIPTKLSLSVPKTTIKIGGSITLTPVIPRGTNTTYTWQTSNKRVATVTNGTVTFKKKGRVTITCIANRGKKKAKVTFKSKQ